MSRPSLTGSRLVALLALVGTSLATAGAARPDDAPIATTDDAPVAKAVVPTDLVVAPRHLELGAHAPGAAVDASIWLINPSEKPLEVVKVEGSCGCMTVAPAFEPTTIPPHHARRLRFTITAPKEAGPAKTKQLAVHLADGGLLCVPVSIESTDAVATVAPRVSPAATTGLHVALEAPRVTGDAPGAPVAATAWVVNDGADDVGLVTVRGGCGCIVIPVATRFDLAPGEARAVPFTIKAPKGEVTEKSTDLSFLTASGVTVKVPIEVELAVP